jgi:hypothetical protein
MNLLALQRGLWVAVLAAEVLLIGTLARRRLFSRYSFFVLYLAADVGWGATLIQIDFRSVAYAYAFRLYLLMICVLRLAAAAEIYERVCEHFRGIGSFRGYMAAVLLTLGVLLSLAFFSPALAPQWRFPQTLAMLFERYETTILCCGLILTRLALHHFLRVRPPIRPNVLRHWTLLAAYFGVGAVSSGAVLILGGGRLVVPINLAMLLADLICMLTWARSLTIEGEIVPSDTPWSEEGLARRRAIADGVLDLVERTRDEFLNRR